MDDYLTTTQAADYLGVGTTSIKRWADQGLLPCEKTPGSHRRFARADVEAFRRRRIGVEADTRPLPPDSPGIDAWVRLLISAPEAAAVQSRLLEERSRRGSWMSVVDHLGAVLDEVGERWRRGQITVVQEHVASETLARALARAGEALAVDPGASLALLAAAEGDDHTLGLSMVEVCLRELGWRTHWAGRAAPFDEISQRIAEGDVAVVLLSASSASRDADRLREQLERLAPACREHGVRLLLGGQGRWPEPPPEPAVLARDFTMLLDGALAGQASHAV